MKSLFPLTLAAIMAAAPAMAADADHIVRKMSPHTVADTIDRLTDIAESKGATVFARVDHAGGAEKAGMTLTPSQLLIFGNPKIGTPLMQSAPELGLDLPLKALAYRDDDGQVWLVYRDPKAVAAAHGVTGGEKAAKAIGGLTDAAVKP